MAAPALVINTGTWVLRPRKHTDAVLARTMYQKLIDLLWHTQQRHYAPLCTRTLCTFSTIHCNDTINPYIPETVYLLYHTLQRHFGHRYVAEPCVLPLPHTATTTFSTPLGPESLCLIALRRTTRRGQICFHTQAQGELERIMYKVDK